MAHVPFSEKLPGDWRGRTWAEFGDKATQVQSYNSVVSACGLNG